MGVLTGKSGWEGGGVSFLEDSIRAYAPVPYMYCMMNVNNLRVGRGLPSHKRSKGEGNYVADILAPECRPCKPSGSGSFLIA